MVTKKVPFNYFYQQFCGKVHQSILENKYKQINDYNNTTSNNKSKKEEKLMLYNKVLYDICTDYINLSNSSITVLPQDTLELVELILDTTQENSYQESFLLSLQFIYQNYFECLEKGYPMLMSSDDVNALSSLQVTLDSCNQLIQFDSTNMELVEQDRIMTKLLSMEINNQQGPIPKVLYRIRKDV